MTRPKPTINDFILPDILILLLIKTSEKSGAVALGDIFHPKSTGRYPHLPKFKTPTCPWDAMGIILITDNTHWFRKGRLCLFVSDQFELYS